MREATYRLVRSRPVPVERPEPGIESSLTAWLSAVVLPAWRVERTHHRVRIRPFAFSRDGRLAGWWKFVPVVALDRPSIEWRRPRFGPGFSSDGNASAGVGAGAAGSGLDGVAGASSRALGPSLRELVFHPLSFNSRSIIWFSRCSSSASVRWISRSKLSTPWRRGPPIFEKGCRCRS